MKNFADWGKSYSHLSVSVVEDVNYLILGFVKRVASV